jgi:hypothetical protein
MNQLVFVINKVTPHVIHYTHHTHPLFIFSLKYPRQKSDPCLRIKIVIIITMCFIRLFSHYPSWNPTDWFIFHHFYHFLWCSGSSAVQLQCGRWEHGIPDPSRWHTTCLSTVLTSLMSLLSSLSPPRARLTREDHPRVVIPDNSSLLQDGQFE